MSLTRIDEYTYLDLSNIQLLNYKPYSDEITIGLNNGLLTTLQHGKKILSIISEALALNTLDIEVQE